MPYKQYFNSLKIPLKETSKNFVFLFHAIAESFNLLSKFLETILNSHFISRNAEESLWAKERGIVKIKNEETSSYLDRVLNAYEFNKRSSTLDGLTNILKSAINKKFSLRELYLDNWILGEEPLGFIKKDGERHDTTILGADYTSYYFVVSFNDPLTLDEKIYLEELIEIYKPAHVGYHLDARIVDDWKLEDSELLGITTYIE